MNISCLNNVNNNVNNNIYTFDILIVASMLHLTIQSAASIVDLSQRFEILPVCS